LEKLDLAHAGVRIIARRSALSASRGFGRSSSIAAPSRLGVTLRYLFEDCVLDTDKREVGREIDAARQVLNLLAYLIHNRVVSKDHLIAAIWAMR
jgi:DNA-binding response OmpR family regulator